jgi:hypothetical protein
LAWLSTQLLGLAVVLLPATLAYVEKPLDPIPAVISNDPVDAGSGAVVWLWLRSSND